MKKYKRIFISTFLLLFLVHFSLLNKSILSADILLNNFFYKGYQWEISLGRFGLFIIGLLKSYLSIPLLDLTISYLILSIITCLLIDLFDIRKKKSIILTILTIVISPLTSTTLLFHYCSIGYLTAFLSSILSVYLFYKYKNKYIKYLLPILLTGITLSMYQAYLSVLITIFVLYNIKHLLKKEYNKKDTIQYILLLLIGLLLYYLLTKLTQTIFHINMSTYKDANKIGIHTLLNIPNKIIDSYKLFFDFYYKDSILKNSYFKNYIGNTILLMIMIISIIKSIISTSINKKHILLIVLLIILLPVFLNSIILIIEESKIQLLMSMSHLLIPIFILSLNHNKILNTLLVIVTIFLIRNYYIQVQSTYLSLEHTTNTYHTIINNSIQNNYDKVFMIIGNINDKEEEYYKMNYGFISDDNLFWDEYNLKKIAFTKYVQYYIGVNVKFIEENDYNNLIKEEYNDIINYVDNYVIINFNQVNKGV